MRNFIVLVGLLLVAAQPARSEIAGLSVITPFGGYSEGQIITDSATIAAILGGQNAADVVKFGTFNPAIVPAPGTAVQGKTVFTGPLGFSSSATLTATGTTQGTAAPLTSQFTVLTSGAAGAGVQAWTTLQAPQTVLNRTTVPLVVYPPSGAAFEAYAANGGVTINPGLRLNIVMTSATQGYVY